MVKIQNTDSPRCCKDVDRQELSFIAGENAKWDSRFGRQFGNFLQNQSLSHPTIQQSFSLVFIQGIWNSMTQKNMHVAVDSSFVHNCHNLEATKMSF